MIAITYHPEKPGQPWWTPDGRPYTGPPLAIFGGRVRGDKDVAAREFVVRLGGVPADACSLAWEIETEQSMNTGTVLRSGEVTSDLRCVAATVSASKPSVNIRCGVATGTWETSVAQQAPGNGLYSRSDGSGSWTVSFLGTEQADEGARVNVAYAAEGRDTRIVAIGLDGRQHEGSESRSNGPDTFTVLSVTFHGLALKDIEGFRFQSRPYRWFEFKDVALNPASP